MEILAVKGVPRRRNGQSPQACILDLTSSTRRLTVLPGTDATLSNPIIAIEALPFQRKVTYLSCRLTTARGRVCRSTR